MSANMQFATPPPPINLPNMSVPPPTAPNLSAPPPNLTTINTSSSPSSSSSSNFQARFPPNNRDGNRGFFKPFRPYHAPKSMNNSQDALQDEFDGKRLRKSVMRKTVDYNSAIIKTLENRVWQRDFRDRRALQPDVMYYPDLLPPPSYVDNPINAVTTRFVKTATNKMRCPIFCMAWTPEGRRLVTGASSGEFTLWNGLTFNFETILQAHDSPVRTMVWSHNESWMVTGDHAGYVKYWQSNMNNVKMFQAHKEAIRGLSFSPTDHKLATCSDDGTVRIWDFLRCHEERILRGHGADVKCVHWHPQKSLVISGSKDNQQPVKLWDPKTGQSLATLHAHKSTVMDVKWNENGNWLVTASRDHLLKLFDLRNLSQEVQTFRGHKKEASSVAWHPSHEGLFCSGGSDGAILFWHVGADKEVGAIEQAHDSIVWTLAWHPLGHILCSGSNDHTSKFWTRNRPGDLMRDKYNLNTLPAGMAGIDDHEIADEAAEIPGMGPEDRIMMDAELEEESSMIIAPPPEQEKSGGIPGLDLDHATDESKKLASKKVPYSKPIPRNFQAQWNEMESEDPEQVEALSAIVNQLIETTPGAVPLNEVAPNAIILYGKMITVEPGSKLADAILKGNDAIQKMIADGEIEELKDVQPIIPEEIIEPEEYLQDEGDIDFSKVPDVDLPAPLPSSKFAQNPELLKSLNLGGKRKFEQLIGWSEASNSSKTNNTGDDSTNSDTDLRYSTSTTAQDISNYLSQDEDLRRLNAMDRINRDEDLRFGSSTGSSGPGRPDFDLRNAFGDRDFRHTMPPPPFNKSSSSIDSDKNYGDQDNRPRVWDDDKIIGNNNFDNRNVMPPNMINNNLTIGQMTNMPSGINKNHHNMQNINPNMPPSMVPHPNINQQITTNMQNKNNSNMMGGNGGGGNNMNDGPGMNDGQMGGPHMMHMPPNFGPNGPPMPPNSNFNPNFRPPNGNFGPNQHFRPMGPPFGPPGPFNNFPPNFRCPNPNNPPPNFERPGFNQNYRHQMPGNSSGGGNNSGGSYNSGYNKNYDRGGGGGDGGGGNGNNGGYGNNNKNGHNSNSNNNNNNNNRGMNRGSNDNNRNNNYNSSSNNNNNNNNSNNNNNNSNRGRGRDNDQSRGSRSRDNY